MVLTVICFVNQKGGVGKTASVANIGAALARLGRRVLLVDLDPQESLTYSLGITGPAKTIVHFFNSGVSLESCALHHPGGFDLVASDEMLATVTPETYQLQWALMGLDYDFVLLDCSPTLGMMTLAALTAADWVVIPLCPDMLSLKGMTQLLRTLHTVKDQTNAALQLKAVLATRYCARRKMHQDVLAQVRKFFKDVPVYVVRENAAVAESPALGLSVLDYRPNSSGAREYSAIAKELADA